MPFAVMNGINSDEWEIPVRKLRVEFIHLGEHRKGLVEAVLWHAFGDEAYDGFGIGGATDLLSDLVALPAEGGSFPVADYVGPELAAFAFAEPPACDD